MVSYRDRSVFPARREELWRLLRAHLDPDAIRSIHPLIQAQKLLRQEDDTTIVERVIEARGRRVTSQWKLTYQPPERSRWEIVGGDGPWAVGSYLENRYADDPGGTRIETRAELRIVVVPFFFPQGLIVRSILNRIDQEDQAQLAPLGGRPD